MQNKTILTINDIDFGELYRNHFRLAERKPKSVEDWDKKAVDQAGYYGETDTPYVREFISRMDLTGANTLLDIGCGGGAICLAIAKHFQQIYALDYSPAMLEIVANNIKTMQLNNVQAMQKSWEDNWDDIPACDICVSSRSSMVEDLESALNKINEKTKRTAYLTMTVEQDFIASEVLQCINRKSRGFPNYIYAVNILQQQGYKVKVDFLKAPHNPNKNTSLNLKDFIQMVSWSVGQLTEDEVNNLTAYYKNNSNSKALQTNNSWAFLCWSKS